MRSLKWLTLLIVIVACGGAGYVVHDQWPLNNYPNSNRPDSVGVFMANGIFDVSDSNYVAPTAEEFDRTIMGRDDEEVLIRKQSAIDYFFARFGIDFSQGDFAQNGAIALLHVYQDPRWNYRCYKLPGRHVPRSGLIVHDAQYVMAVVADEATLFGSWGGEEGTVVAGGTVAVDGEYLIQGTNRFRQGHQRNVYIRFNSVSPIFNAASGNIKFDCRIHSDRFGVGAAIGRQELYFLENGLSQVAINNVLQFPAPQWTTDN